MNIESEDNVMYFLIAIITSAMLVYICIVCKISYSNFFFLLTSSITMSCLLAFCLIKSNFVPEILRNGLGAILTFLVVIALVSIILFIWCIFFLTVFATYSSVIYHDNFTGLTIIRVVWTKFQLENHFDICCRIYDVSISTDEKERILSEAQCPEDISNSVTNYYILTKKLNWSWFSFLVVDYLSLGSISSPLRFFVISIVKAILLSTL